MPDLENLIAAACLTLGLAAPGWAATYRVDFQILPSVRQIIPVRGQLFFDDVSNGTRNATGVRIISAPGGGLYLGTYAIDSTGPSFLFDGTEVSVSEFFLGFQNPATQTVSLIFQPQVDAGLGTLRDETADDPEVQQSETAFLAPQLVPEDPSPVPLPASLPLMLAGLCGLAALARHARRGVTSRGR